MKANKDIPVIYIRNKVKLEPLSLDPLCTEIDLYFDLIEKELAMQACVSKTLLLQDEKIKKSQMDNPNHQNIHPHLFITRSHLW